MFLAGKVTCPILKPTCPERPYGTFFEPCTCTSTLGFIRPPCHSFCRWDAFVHWTSYFVESTIICLLVRLDDVLNQPHPYLAWSVYCVFPCLLGQCISVTFSGRTCGKCLHKNESHRNVIRSPVKIFYLCSFNLSSFKTEHVSEFVYPENRNMQLAWIIERRCNQ